MGWIGCVRSEKLRHIFVPRTFALVDKCFAPSFVRQSNGRKCTQMVRNAPKQEFRFNGVDRVRTFRKIPMRLRGTNFCTSSAHFPPRFVRQPNSPNCTETHQNMSLGSNGWIRCVHYEPFRCDFVARTFALVRPVLYRVS